MGPNDSDKTVFRQSPAGGTGDATVIRPTPGRRGIDAARAAPAAASHDARSAEPARSAPVDAAPPGVAALRIDRGVNPLVNAASTLIAAMYRTRVSATHGNVGALHTQLTHEIRRFENLAKENGVRPEIVLTARYLLCAALDEAVLNTPWGAESAWTQRTLLSMFHNETTGGEKFFMILERMRQHPAQNLEVLELMYIVLSLGFEGRYRVVNRGRDALEQMRDELFRTIRTHRGDFERTLSTHWTGLGRRRNGLTHHIPLWVLASVVTGFLVLGYTGFRYALHLNTDDLTSELNAIAATEANGISDSALAPNQLPARKP